MRLPRSGTVFRPRVSPAYYYRRRYVPTITQLVISAEPPPPGPTPGPPTEGEPVIPPAPTQFRFIVEDILSGVIKTQDLPLNAWSYDDVLNRAGSVNASIPLTSEFATDELLAPYRTAIYVMRDGRIEWGGILKPPTLSLEAQNLSLNCEGWLGYWDHRTIRTDYAPNQLDQFLIFRRLVLNAQDEAHFGTGYDLGIDVVWDTISGVLRDRSEDYMAFNAKNLGEALRQLAGLEDGFDYAMTYEINTATNRIDKAIKLYHPRKGRDTQFLYEYERDVPGNVLQRGFADPVDFAWVGDGSGSGNDVTRLKSAYIDESLRGIYPPFDAAPTFSSVTVQTTLDENTAAAFGRTNRPKRVPVLQVDPSKDPKWGDVEVGDTVQVRIIDGYGSSGILPRETRIVGTSVTHDGKYTLVMDADAPDLDISPVEPPPVVVTPPEEPPPPPPPPPTFPTFPVGNYGAVGNGTTNDTLAIQAALDAAAANPGGGNVTGLAGLTYMISAPLTYGSNTILSGNGCTIRNLTSRANNNTAMLAPKVSGVSGFIVEDVNFDQRSDWFDPTFGYRTDQACVEMSYTSNSKVQRCRFDNIRTVAIYATGDTAHPVAALTIQNNTIDEAAGAGISIVGKGSGLVVHMNNISDTHDDAIQLLDATVGQLTTSTVTNNTLTNIVLISPVGSTPVGIRLAGTATTLLTNNSVTNTYGSALAIVAGVTYRATSTTVQNNTFTQAGNNTDGSTPTESVTIDGADGVTATSNTITANVHGSADTFIRDATGVVGWP